MCTADCGCNQRHGTRVNLAKSEYRYETFRGRRHIVVPIIMAKSDVVMNGALFPEEEYMPESWNGVPVTVGHPQDSANNFLSANSPDVLEDWAVGHIFNAHVKDGQLRGEAWIDVVLADNTYKGLIAALVNSEGMDVSTGYFCEPEKKLGEVNGQKFNEIARAVRPDHLALLPTEMGACSWADGCGVRSNRSSIMMKAKEAVDAIRDALGLKESPEEVKPVTNQQENDDMSENKTPTLTEDQVKSIVANAVADALKSHKPELSAEDQAALASAHKIIADKRAGLVSHITANSAITKEQAEAMDLATLETVANGLTVPQPDFTGRALPRTNSGEPDKVAQDMQPPSIVELFRKKQ